MNFLKKPFVAVLLSALIICGSTLLSADIKLGRECQNITDGFYEGVVYENYQHKSIASQIRNICGAADGMVTIANNYDIDTDAIRAATDEMKSALTYGSVSYLHYLYDELLQAVKPLEDQLSRAELSDRDAEGFAQYSSTISGAQSVIENSGYNESVRAFLRDEIHFPADFFAELAGVELPELFA
ncbi:MAG: hypothetical protein SPI09_06225 [Candidatus Limivicinus sp.]|nr:hypothetical protein [Clostridiales bacterium]MDY6132942.1 hypothetical protein [Candidatus Limivicinus sp.]